MILLKSEQNGGRVTRVVLEDNKLSVSEFHWLRFSLQITASTIRRFLRIKLKLVFSIAILDSRLKIWYEAGCERNLNSQLYIP